MQCERMQCGYAEDFMMRCVHMCIYVSHVYTCVSLSVFVFYLSLFELSNLV
jgi:hypothetical protein